MAATLTLLIEAGVGAATLAIGVGLLRERSRLVGAVLAIAGVAALAHAAAGLLAG